jgi:hypothetical protein
VLQKIRRQGIHFLKQCNRLWNTGSIAIEGELSNRIGHNQSVWTNKIHDRTNFDGFEKSRTGKI